MPTKKPRFQKKIIQPGTYAGHEVTANRIQHWVDQFKKMREKGFLIPAPYRHDKQAVPVRSPDLDDANTKINAGFWDKVWVDSKGVMWGEVEAADEEAANVIRNKAKQCSLAAPQKWIQGEEEWEDPITHIALTNKAKAPTGDEFVPVVAMSEEFPFEVYSMDKLPTEVNDNTVGQDTGVTSSVGVDTVLQLLRKQGIGLPDDTNESNFLEYLTVALTAISTNEEKQEGKDDLTKQPEGSRAQKPSPIAMSHELEFAVELLNAQGLKDTDTNEAFTVDGLKKAAEDKRKKAHVSLSAEDQATVNWARNSAIKTVTSTINGLVENMQISPDLAKKTVDRLNENFPIELSADGQQKEQWFDWLIEGWQNIPRGSVTGQKVPTNDQQFSVNFEAANMKVEQPPQEGSPGFMTEEEAEKEADRILAG